MAKMIVVLAVLALIVGVVFYVVSDPFKTKVDMGIHEMTDWSETNILADPVGYLTWGLGRVDKSIDAMSARRIGLSQQRSKNHRMIADDSEDLEAAERLFDQFRDGYKEASGAGTWPKEVAGTSYDEKSMKTKIVQFNNKVDGLRKQIAQVTTVQETIDSNLAQLDVKLADAKTTKIEIARQIEIVKTNKAIEGLDDLRSDVDGLAGVADFLAQTGTEPTVDQLIQKDRSTISDEEFSRILNLP